MGNVYKWLDETAVNADELSWSESNPDYGIDYNLFIQNCGQWKVADAGLDKEFHILCEI